MFKLIYLNKLFNFKILIFYLKNYFNNKNDFIIIKLVGLFFFIL